MISLQIVCLGSVISVAIFFLVTRFALLREKHVCQRAIADMKLSKEIVLLVRDVANEEARLAKHSKIREYLEGINYVFSMRFLDCKEVKVVKVRAFNDHRVALLNDYKTAPREVQELAQRYSLILGEIYRINHPMKWKLDQAGMKMLRWIIRHILIPFLDFLQRALHEDTQSRKRKDRHKNAGKGMDYREQLSLDTGRMTVAT